MRRLLDSHSNIHCPPEIKWFKDFYGDYMHDELAHVRFFKTLHTLGLSEQELMHRFGHAYVECRELASVRLGCGRWADKNPENVLYLEQWGQLLEHKFLFLHVVRHPLDTLASLCNIGFEKAVPTTFEGKANLMRRYFECADVYRKQYIDRYKCLKYEALVETPELILSSMFEWMGEPYESKVLELFWSEERKKGIEDPKVAHTRNIHSTSLGRWKSDLSDGQIKIAEDILGDVLTRYGYSSL